MTEIPESDLVITSAFILWAHPLKLMERVKLWKATMIAPH